MFYHIKELQYEAKSSKPDPLYAKKLQEVLGGQYGEISVMMQYLFQGFNCRADQKYRDLLFDVGTEEIGHVEMLATMIARLLDKAPVEEQEQAYQSDPALAAVMGGMNSSNPHQKNCLTPQKKVNKKVDQVFVPDRLFNVREFFRIR